MTADALPPLPAEVTRVLSDGRRAPELMIHYTCPVCFLHWVLDAYKGVPLCPHDRAILAGERLA